jgi:hypothetical protein
MKRPKVYVALVVVVGEERLGARLDLPSMLAAPLVRLIRAVGVKLAGLSRLLLK